MGELPAVNTYLYFRPTSHAHTCPLTKVGICHFLPFVFFAHRVLLLDVLLFYYFVKLVSNLFLTTVVTAYSQGNVLVTLLIVLLLDRNIS